MITLLQEWQSYVSKVIPATAPVVQREESRRAFYAGALAMFKAIIESTADDDDDMVGRRLVELSEEVRQISQELRFPDPKHGSTPS